MINCVFINFFLLFSGIVLQSAENDTRALVENFKGKKQIYVEVYFFKFLSPISEIFFNDIFFFFFR